MIDYELKAHQYEARKAARRGHNHKYLSDTVLHDLQSKGYSQHESETRSEAIALVIRDSLRKQGNFARIFCLPNSLRIKTYGIFYRKK